MATCSAVGVQARARESIVSHRLDGIQWDPIGSDRIGSPSRWAQFVDAAIRVQLFGSPQLSAPLVSARRRRPDAKASEFASKSFGSQLR